MRMIPDPLNPEGAAIDTETGRLAGPVRILTTPPEDPAAPTVAEVMDGTHIGWMTGLEIWREDA